jgi:hypothetical protein
VVTRETLIASLRGAREIVSDLGHTLGSYVIGAIALLIASCALIWLLAVALNSH